MIRKLFFAALLALMPAAAEASNCSGNPFTLTNGQTADATQVMANFNNLLNCSNNNLAHNGANSDITSLSALSTPLSVSQGGTGVATFTATNGLLVGNGTTAITSIDPSTAGNILSSNGTAWVSTPAVNSIADAANGGLTFSAATGAVTASLNVNNTAFGTLARTSTFPFANATATTFQQVVAGAADSILAVAAASKSEMETATNNTIAVTPLNLNNADAVPKVVCFFNGNTAGTNACIFGVNTTSVTRNSAGDYTVTFTTAFSSANYMCTYGAGNQTASQRYVYGPVGAPVTNAIHIQITDTVNTVDAVEVMVTCYGRQ